MRGEICKTAQCSPQTPNAAVTARYDAEDSASLHAEPSSVRIPGGVKGVS